MWEPGWRNVPLRNSDPPPRALSDIGRDAESAEVVLKCSSLVSGRGELRSLSAGQRTSLPIALARAMVASGSAEPSDRRAPWARGVTRMIDLQGHQVRVTRGGVTTSA